MNKEIINKFFFAKCGIDVKDAECIPWPDLVVFKDNGEKTKLSDYVLHRLSEKGVFPEFHQDLSDVVNKSGVILDIGVSVGTILQEIDLDNIIGFYSAHKVYSSRPELINPETVAKLSAFNKSQVSKELLEMLELNMAYNFKIGEEFANADSASYLINYVLTAGKRQEDNRSKNKEHIYLSYVGITPAFKEYVYKNIVFDGSTEKLNKILKNLGLS